MPKKQSQKGRSKSSKASQPGEKIRVFFKEILDAWSRHKTEQMGAAFAFYTILSLPSLIILIFSLATFFLSDRQVLLNTVNSIFTPEIAADAEKIIQAAVKTTPKNTAAIFGFLALFWSASLLFENLKNSLRTIFETAEEVQKPHQQIKTFLWNRIWAFIFIIFIEVILFLSLILKNALAAAKNFLNANISTIGFIIDLMNLITGFLIPFVLFLFIFKFLAKIQISWRNAAIGSGITTFLFILGNQLLSIYFSRFIDFSAFGAASTVIAVLIWIYYISQIIFLGAECTRAYAEIQKTSK